MKHPFHLASAVVVIIFSAFIFVGQRQPGPAANLAQVTGQNSTNASHFSEALASEPAAAVQWKAYDAGLNLAKTQQKPVFVEFFATWCGYCKKMDKEVFSNKNVQKLLNQYFVAIRVTESSENEVKYQNNTVTEKQLTSMSGVTGFPTLMFLDTEGNEITKLPGYIGPEEMGSVLKFIGTKAYKKMDYPTFQKQNARS